MTKDEIRKNILTKRNGLSKDEVLDKSRRIFEKLTDMSVYQKAQKVLIYASMSTEVITDDIIVDALSKGKKVFCPKCTDIKNGKMEFVRIDSLDQLVKGYFGIREPVIKDDSEIYGNIGDNDGDTQNSVVIMPLVAFDDENNRIGYKGGYYDRFLERFADISTIALAFEIQRSFDIIPSESHDIKPQIVITEL